MTTKKKSKKGAAKNAVHPTADLSDGVAKLKELRADITVAEKRAREWEGCMAKMHADYLAKARAIERALGQRVAMATEPLRYMKVLELLELTVDPAVGYTARELIMVLQRSAGELVYPELSNKRKDPVPGVGSKIGKDLSKAIGLHPKRVKKKMGRANVYRFPKALGVAA